MKKIGVLNGPNLDRLGLREPNIYGSTTLKQIEDTLTNEAHKIGCEINCFQSNHEGFLIDKIHEWTDKKYNGLIINPGGFTHTSVAIRDAISSSCIKTVEVHLTNIHAREEFRKNSLISGIVEAIIAGMGHNGYLHALRFLANNT